MSGELESIKVKQEAMSEDISELKSSLSRLTDVLESLSRLEERNESVIKVVDRISNKMDMQEDRLRVLENKMASQLWIERIAIVVVIGIFTTISKGWV